MKSVYPSIIKIMTMKRKMKMAKGDIIKLNLIHLNFLINIGRIGGFYMALKEKRKFINKKSLFKFLLYWYIGGSSYFFGTAVSNLFLVFACAFFFTHFIGNQVLISLISDEPLEYAIENRYLNLILNLVSNFIIVITIVYTNQFLFEKGIFEFVLEPFTFGIVYSIIYIIYLKFTLK